MVTSKTMLKRLEHINLAEWRSLNNIDTAIRICDGYLRSGKTEPYLTIHAAETLTIYSLWGLPCTKFSFEKIFAKALAAGQKYIQTKGIYETGWLDNMMALMVIASLQEDDAELIRFSNWFKTEKLPPSATLDDWALLPILYYVADMFRDEKFESFKGLEKAQGNRVKVPSLLMSALDGMRSRNSKKTFDDLIAAALDHARRTRINVRNDKINSTGHITARYHSLLWNVAELQGLHPPTIPPEIRPFMVIRQTLGLSPISATNGGS